jgi:hypothetical protein
MVGLPSNPEVEGILSGRRVFRHDILRVARSMIKKVGGTQSELRNKNKN